MFNLSSRTRARATLQGLCFVVMLAFFPPVPISSARADTSARQPAMTISAQPACLGWTWSRLLAPMERLVGNQRRMIQFGVISLVSAMYIIWWRK